LPKFLIVAFFYAIGSACNTLAAGLDALTEGEEAPPAPPPEPPAVPSTPPPDAIQGETYAEFFARTGSPVFGPDGHEISGFHVFDGEVWAPQTA